MADITLSTSVDRPNFIQSIGQTIADSFARYRWHRFQLKAATLNDRLLADIGIDRRALSSATTEYEFVARDEIFVPRHNLG